MTAAAYRSLVADDQQTRNRPATWEGHLADGRHFAFTYRDGTAYLTTNPGTAEWRTAEAPFGTARGNTLDVDQYHHLFIRLAAELGVGADR